LQVQEVIDAALASTAGLIEAGHFTVECEIEEQLPQVVGDASALSQCLQNLITNALKYGNEQCWIGIRAKAHENGSAGKKVQMSRTEASESTKRTCLTSLSRSIAVPLLKPRKFTVPASACPYRGASWKR
jgi:signal transduction histidine kinase